MIFPLILLTILAICNNNSNGSITEENTSIWDDLRMVNGDEGTYDGYPIEDEQDEDNSLEESFEAGFGLEDYNISGLEQSNEMDNLAIRSVHDDCVSNTTETPQYMDYDESLRIGSSSMKNFNINIIIIIIIIPILLFLNTLLITLYT